MKLNENETDILRRLLDVAYRDSGQSRKVANLLLSWWNADTCGALDLRDLWGLDTEIKIDAVKMIVIITAKGHYPDSLGFEREFKKLVRLWRPHLLK